MSFTLLPAVDVAAGQAMRLIQGDADSATTYGSPREAALAWQRDGAEWIHLVDLDAAFGRGSNAELLAAVIGELKVCVELAGGIRDDATLNAALSSGAERVILGTAAVRDLAWCARVIDEHGERIAISLDVSVTAQLNSPVSSNTVQHRLVARGSTRDDGDLFETIARLDQAGCARYIVTDVSRDGMLGGPNIELYRLVTLATSAAVIASGGISAIADLHTLGELASTSRNLEGAVVGKALYAGRFTLSEALAAVRDIGDIDVALDARRPRR